ncbi:MAG TPA: MAPEG family protein [Polyangiales bacterium]|nr:MAPEG family protein [Polyangiales bacterium]
MTTELTLLCWTVVLALVQVGLAGTLRTRETGTGYNLSPRDSPGPPVGTVTARLQRAQSNLYETLPLFVAAVLTAHVAGREGALTLWGSILYLAGRVIYVPLYAFGIPGIRTLVWLVAAAGLLLVLLACLLPN